MSRSFTPPDTLSDDDIRTVADVRRAVWINGLFGLVNTTFPGFFGSGVTYSAQFWFRDVLCGPPPAPCPSPCSMNANFTNGVSFTVTP